VDVRDEVLEVLSPHHSVVFVEKKSPAPPLQNRTWLSELLSQKVCDAPLTYVWVTVPIEDHAKIAPKDEAHAIRALIFVDGVEQLLSARLQLSLSPA
jgi:hypothetical protein